MFSTVVKVAAIGAVIYIGVKLVTKKSPIQSPVIKSVTTVNNPFDASQQLSVAPVTNPAAAGVRT